MKGGILWVSSVEISKKFSVRQMKQARSIISKRVGASWDIIMTRYVVMETLVDAK
jgi:hypothetical protein